MVRPDVKFDFDDLLIVHKVQSKIDFRKEISVYDKNGMLPLFTAPMDTVIGLDNLDIFKKNKIYSIVPRTVNIEKIYLAPITTHDKYGGVTGVSGNDITYSKSFKYYEQWVAYGLLDFENFLNENQKLSETRYILIDIAHGGMKRLHDLVKKAKFAHGDDLQLMVGNVANPETYRLLSEAGADYVRVGIGNGGGCLTSQNVGVGYPLASLISECYDISVTLKNPAKIVADGGMKNYSDVIKSLALGADYVMLGSILNRALESAGETFRANVKHQGVEIWTEPGEPVDQYSEDIKNAFANGAKFYKKFRGMSTKSVQKLLGNAKLKTSEGVTRMNPVEYTIEGWVENFMSYLASAMSYTGTFTLEEYIGEVELVRITQASFNRFNK